MLLAAEQHGPPEIAPFRAPDVVRQSGQRRISTLRVLLLGYTEPGAMHNGPSIILTNTLAWFGQRRDVDAGVGLLKSGERDATAPFNESSAAPVLFRFDRHARDRGLMLRAALGGPLVRSEKAFLEACRKQSRRYDMVVWFGFSWDPVSLRLPGVCSCPVVNHPTDSITLAQKNRLPGIARNSRTKVAGNVEKRVLRAGYSMSIYNSPQDARLAASLVPSHERDRIIVLPIGVDTDTFHPARKQTVNERVRIIFSGAMGYRPNVDAALALATEILPWVTANVEVRIVGRNPAPEVMQLHQKDPRVVITGEVPDMADELRACDIFAAPMVSGGGISNKVLEAMACGLPVVTTPLVATNFPDSPAAMRVANSSREIAREIDLLANDAQLRTQLGAEAAEYIRNGNWSWQGRADRLLELFAKCGDGKTATTAVQ